MRLAQTWRAGLLALSLAVEAGGVGAGVPPASTGPSVEARDDGLWVTWTAPAAVRFASGPDGTVIPTLDGFSPDQRPGHPQLPVASVLVALPPGTTPEVALVAAETQAVALPAPLAVAPAPEGVVLDNTGRVLSGAFAPAREAVVTPEAPVRLAVLGVVRGVRLARLSFSPLRPAGSGLELTTRLVVHVPYTAPAEAAEAAANPMLAALRQAVVNPGHVAAAARPAPAAPNALAHTAAGPTVIVEVAAPGLTSLTYADLAAVGFPLAGVDPATLQLSRAGAAVAMEWEGDGDAAFEPGERLLFYASPRFSRWTRFDAYTLTAGAGPGLRMGQRAASPAGLPPAPAWHTQLAEVDQLYTPDCLCAPLPPGRDGDRWTWESLARPGTATLTKTISLPSVAATQPATLTVWAIGYTDVPAAPDHRLSVRVNNVAVGQAQWEGKQAITFTLPLSAGLLATGSNTVTFTLPGLPGVGVEGAWLDAYQLEYALGAAPLGPAVHFTGHTGSSAYTLPLAGAGVRGYDITQPDQPERLTGFQVGPTAVTLGQAGAGPRRYILLTAAAVLAPAHLRLAQPLPALAGADYLIISPPGFVPSLAPLIAHRQQQGLSVAVADLQAIYDATGGRPEPEAIRAYLAEAYAAWDPAPTYVLLVGDGTSDPKRHRPNSFATIVPPYLADVDPWAGETAADNLYASVDGDDHLPDLLIGRLPANTAAEAGVMASKIVHYKQMQYTTGWNAAAVFVADDADTAGNHPALAASLAEAHIQPPFAPQTVEFAPPTTTVTATRQAVLNAWNAGAGVMVYAGHASTHQWAAERLFHDSEVSQLANGPRLPVLLELTCFTGSFHVPGLATLDESLVRHPTGGAIAAWGATGLGIATGHAQLAAGFLPGLYAGDDLGTAALAGKLAVAAHRPDAADLINTFGLLGDPATQLFTSLAPWPARLYLPATLR